VNIATPTTLQIFSLKNILKYNPHLAANNLKRKIKSQELVNYLKKLKEPHGLKTITNLKCFRPYRVAKKYNWSPVLKYPMI
jgi:hypothetical protein